MIVFAEERHIRDIARLWFEAFGDREAEVLVYLDTLLKYCIVFEEDGKVMGMLFLLPVNCGVRKGRYVYAVATFKAYRGRGISTELLDFAKKFIDENNESFLVLVPQSKSLFDFYENRGFKAFSCVNKITGCHVEENEIFSCKVISPDEYFEKRKEYLTGDSLIEWDVYMLGFAKKMYDGDFIMIEEYGREIGIAFMAKGGNEVFVKEVLSENFKKAIAAIQNICNTEKLSIVYPDKNAVPFAMMYPEVYTNTFFNIALD